MQMCLIAKTVRQNVGNTLRKAALNAKQKVEEP